MLQELSIKNYGIFAAERLTFLDGMSTLTGETGAGKSLIVGALSLILGARANQEDIRAGCDEANIEARFLLEEPKNHLKLLALLEEFGFALEDGAVTIRRQLQNGGRGRAFVNGNTATLQQLQKIGPHLVDLSGQHEQQLLLDESRHQEFVDAYGQHQERLSDYRQIFQTLHYVRNDIATIQARQKSSGERLDFLNFRIKELTQLQLKYGEEEELRQLHKKMQNSIKLFEFSQEAVNHLHEAEGNVLERLGQVRRLAERAVELDPGLAATLQSLQAAKLHTEESASLIARYGESLNFDAKERDRVEERLFKLAEVSRKYGSIEAALRDLAGMEGEVLGLQNADHDIETLNAQAQNLERQLLLLGRNLSEARHLASKKLAKVVELELAELAMEGARFQVLLTANGNGQKSLALTDSDGITIQAAIDGFEQVQCLFSANRGEELRPLAKVASGGELSRVLLAIKLILATGEAETFIFDEIDAGIGGRQGEVVGRKLKTLVRVGAKKKLSRQVLCVTHLPTIAAYGDHHFNIAKIEEKGRTISRVTLLDAKQRKTEIARMLAGQTITSKTLAHAEELLQNAAVT